MKYNKLTVLLILFFIPIVKADGCGLSCPKHPDSLMSLSLIVICNLFTWSFCHIFSFFIMLILVIVTFIFWKSQSEKKKKKVKLFLFGLIGLFFIVLLYPYIRAWVYTPLSTPNPCDTDTWANPDSTICYLEDAGSLEHTPNGCSTEYCKYKIVGGGPTSAIASFTTNESVIATYELDCVDKNVIRTVTLTNLNAGLPYILGIGFSEC